MCVITISREMGSAGTDIAQLLVREMDCTFLDRKTVEDVLEDHGIDKDRVKRYDERKPGFWDRIALSSDKYLHFLKAAVYDVAREGNCIILGRGGQMVLGDLPGVLSVRIMAAKEKRLLRIRKKFECDTYFAEQIMNKSDRNRAGFHRFFFHAQWDAPDLYDMVINTSKMSVNSAAQMILHTKDLPQFREREAYTKGELVNRSLAHEVETALVYQAGIPLQFLDIVADDGKVTIKGNTASTESIKRVEEVANQVDGVNEVVNHVKLMHFRYDRI